MPIQTTHRKFHTKPTFNSRFKNKRKINRFPANKRSRGERIDFSRFIKKATHVEEKPYVSKHTFADFPFNPQLHKNIERAGFASPR
ncbi:MAG: hypothetical protein ACREGC_02600, partial [Minisyncoccia bacterium]